MREFRRVLVFVTERALQTQFAPSLASWHALMARLCPATIELRSLFLVVGAVLIDSGI